MKFLALLILSLIHAAPVFAGFSSNQAASSVLGKTDFASSADAAPSATNIGRIEGVAVDPVSGKLFVADVQNHRILRYSAAAAYQSGAAAEVVLGQANFTSGEVNRGGATAANTLSEPTSLTIDAAGRLWVADRSNHRVLRYDNAASKANGASADGVLGQGSFLDNLPGLGVSSFEYPGGVYADSGGRLWVADSGNHRVLRFDNAAALGNGANAIGVLGQLNFTSDTASATATAMNAPWGLCGDATGRLFVADRGNNRVLRFNGAAAKSNGGAADAVLGQADFVTNALAATSTRSLNQPYYLTLAPDGTLWVGDQGDRRVLGYRTAATKANGAAADLVLGQPTFTQSNNYGATDRSVVYSSQIAPGRGGSLFIGDYNLRRVMRFSPAVELRIPGPLMSKNGSIKVKGTSAFADRVEYKAPRTGFKRAQGTAARWSFRLRGLTKATTKVQVRATAFDGRSTKRVLTIRTKKPKS